MDSREVELLHFIQHNPGLSSREIFEGSIPGASYATVKRSLTLLLSDKLLLTKGQGKGTRYYVSPVFELLQPVDLEQYYRKEIDERTIKSDFNPDIFEVLSLNDIFTQKEIRKLDLLQNQFTENLSMLSENQYKKEFERLAIDLSWKSSQIEGNTYSLLETERLLREKETASGKTKDEAVMLLNHKDALDFIIEHTDYLIPLAVSKIEDIHSILIKELGVDKNLRRQRVGISGTNYRPLDNEFQILEALKLMCDLINKKENVFEKALLSLVLISYIQPFMDGNKRTARIVSNAILLNYRHCPISFRTVDSIDYKKALLLFYEQNNISGFKEIFINQFEFAVNTYF
jgi:Fic family protein